MNQNNGNDSENEHKDSKQPDTEHFTTDKPSRSASRKSHRYTKLIITLVAVSYTHLTLPTTERV